MGADRLESQAIEIGLSVRPAGLTVLTETDSTNAEIDRLPPEQRHRQVVVAEQQTRGRGRRTRKWFSPPGGNIYLSLGWRFEGSGPPLSTLPLAVAVCVVRALERAGLRGHGIKWPNDILAGGKKLAGILVEMQSSGGPALAVVGIGLNVRMPADSGAGEKIDLPWTDLASELPDGSELPPRNRICVFLIEELLPGLEHFAESGLAGFEDEWQERDLLAGGWVRVEQNGQIVSGTARGIDREGGLLLETQDGGLQTFHSGDVSVRRG